MGGFLTDHGSDRTRLHSVRHDAVIIATVRAAGDGGASTGGGIPGDLVVLLILIGVPPFLIRRGQRKRDRRAGRPPPPWLPCAMYSDRSSFDRGALGAALVILGSLISISLEALSRSPFAAFLMGAFVTLLLSITDRGKVVQRAVIAGVGALGLLTALASLFGTNDCRGALSSQDRAIALGLVMLTVGVAAVLFVVRSLTFHAAKLPEMLNAFAALLSLILFAANYAVIEGALTPGNLPYAVAALVSCVAVGITIEPRFTAEALSIGTAAGGLIIVTAVGGSCLPAGPLFAVLFGMAAGWFVTGLRVGSRR